MSTDVQAADGTDAEPKKPKKSKKKFIIIGVILLLVVGYEAQSILLKPHYKVGQVVPAGVVNTLGQLTINLSDGHLVQVTVALQLSKVAAIKTINTDLPRFEDAITTVFGDQTYAGLLKPAGRLAAKAQILALCQKITGTVNGAAQQVQAIYFTGFVIQ
jgi:flagellar basal body-associated protein FliL